MPRRAETGIPIQMTAGAEAWMKLYRRGKAPLITNTFSALFARPIFKAPDFVRLSSIPKETATRLLNILPGKVCFRSAPPAKEDDLRFSAFPNSSKLQSNNRICHKRHCYATLPFYNFLRGDVLVANHWQAAADNAVLLRLMRELTIDPALCPATDASASPDGRIRFDPRFFFAMGFSMGGTILGSWAGVDPGIMATIPSGGSGHWGLLIRNFTAVPAKPYVFAWLTGGRPGEPMDMRWPVISIIQAVLEPCDTITFGPHMWQRPVPGHPARHVYLALGRNDFYTQPITQNALINALGLPLAGPVRDESALIGQRLLGYSAPLDFPVSGNLRSANGQTVTGAALQYEPDPWTGEGHNVNYNLTETRHQYGCFLRTLVDTGQAVIPGPAAEGTPCLNERKE